jgi:hypothetical protein
VELHDMILDIKRLVLILAFVSSVAAFSHESVVWRFNNLAGIGGSHTTIIGSPKVADTELGKAVHFEGNASSGDALFIDAVPLTGASAYTFEVIFRPSSAGAQAQRFFHLQEAGTGSRRMFELRILQNKWCLDAVAFSSPKDGPHQSGVIANCDSQHLFPLDRWYAVAATYDGKVLRSYVDGVLQGEIAVALLPIGNGGTSVGTRYTKQDYFTGDVFSARFTPRAIPVDQLIHVPSKP